FGAGVQRGVVSIQGLTEASGIAASQRNPGVLWTWNDGPGRDIYALDASGRHLATFFLSANVVDKEDLAVGPGPVSGLSYLYAGDVGGNDGSRQVHVLRIPEPFVDVGRINSPVSQAFSGVSSFTLTYPDGAYG